MALAGQHPDAHDTGLSLGQVSGLEGTEQPEPVHVAPAGQQPAPHVTGYEVGQLPGTGTLTAPRPRVCTLVAPWLSRVNLRCDTPLEDAVPVEPPVPAVLPAAPLLSLLLPLHVT